MQGLAPLLLAGFSDGAGRRPAYIVCFVVYMGANIGLALQNSYAALMVLRCVQSGGISATNALGNGVVADLAAPSERGSYIGYTALGVILGPIIGPTIGGFIAQYLGWHWIFWICAIFGGLFFVALALFLPETCRKIVGDGSVPPPKLNASLASILRDKRRTGSGGSIDVVRQAQLRQNYRLQFPNPFGTLVLFKDPATAIILVSNALSYAGVFAITAGAPSQFQEIYHLNAGKLGLVFIPFGVGSIVAAITTGTMINRNFQRHALRLNLPMARNRYQDLADFPIEKARLEVALPTFYLGAGTMIAYGWVLQFQTNLAGPLIMLFLMGWSLVSASQAISVLMVDIHPERAASVSAAGNLSRCLLAAGSSAAIVPMINAMGKGWAYTVTSLAWVVFSPLLWVLAMRGHGWRRQRKEAERAKMEDAKALELVVPSRNKADDEIVTAEAKRQEGVVLSQE